MKLITPFFALIIAIFAFVPWVQSHPHASPNSDNPSHIHLLKNYGQIPLSFEANEGQWNDKVDFLTRGLGYRLFLTPTESILSLSKPFKDSPDKKYQTTTLHMKLLGANISPKVEGVDPISTKTNYFLGKDPKKWRTQVSNFAKVKYEEVYPGIDLVYYGKQRKLEYDFIVHPGSDYKIIKMNFAGADKIHLDDQGNLVLSAKSGKVVQHAPVIYQVVNGKRKIVSGEYVLDDKNSVGFQIAQYDLEKSLIIDPVLEYSTFIGGPGFEQGLAMAVDNFGNSFVAGETRSMAFPTSDTSQRLSKDVFVAKLNSLGSMLEYSAFIGGVTDEQALGIAVDSNGNAYVTGRTSSVDFPTTPGSFDPSHNGGPDVFALKLSSDGSTLEYSTFLGGSANERAWGIAVDSSGKSYVVGATSSANFPTTFGAFDTTVNGSLDAFVTKLNATGSALEYSTLIGGGNSDRAWGIVLNELGNAYVGGETQSANFPTTPGAFDTVHNGLGDGFVVKLNQAGSVLEYSTFIGGSDFDWVFDIAVDTSGNAYLAGGARANNFPTTPGAFDNTYDGNEDAYVAKLNSTGSFLEYSTFLGGSGFDRAMGIRVDGFGSAFVTGISQSNTFPVTLGAFDTSYNGGSDGFLVKVDPQGSSLDYSTFIGGTNSDEAWGISLDGKGNIFIAGQTFSPLITNNFPITSGAFDTTFNGGRDGFAVKFSGFPIDNSPPFANAGPDQLVEQQGPSGSNVTFNGLGSSDPEGDILTFSWSGPLGTATGATPILLIPEGTHPVTLLVNDGTVDSEPDIVQVTVVDTTPPALTTPANITEQATGPLTHVNLVEPIATDVVGVDSLTNDAPVGGFSVDSTTTVIWTATDVAGNSSITTQMVTINPFLLSLDIKRAKFKLHKKKNGKDKIEITGRFSEFENGDGLNLKEATVSVGDVVIPRVKFKRNGRFEVKGKKLDLSGIDFSHPVTVSIRIGNDFGEQSILFDKKGRFKDKDNHRGKLKGKKR